MRTFIAFELAQEIKNYLALIQEELKKSAADVKWVLPQNIHLTLKFIGEIDEELSEGITKIIEKIAGSQTPFSLSLASLGAFPKINSPRVIWVGVDKGKVESEKIARALGEELEKIGIPAEKRKFSSHITIGRVRSMKNREKLTACLNELCAKEKVAKPQIQISKITLYKSTLTPKGPIYEILKEASLKAT